MAKMTESTKRQVDEFNKRELALDDQIFGEQPSGRIPDALKTGNTAFRKRGDASDLETINTICGLVAQGVIAVEAVKQANLPWATWHKWRRLNHCKADERYDFAYKCHLEAMADKTLKVYEALEAKREQCLEKYYAEHRAWREWSKDNDEDRRPPEPLYEGPAEWELNSAKEKVKQWNIHLEAGLVRFRRRQETTLNTNTSQSIVHEVEH
jgi:hypothetical protein